MSIIEYPHNPKKAKKYTWLKKQQFSVYDYIWEVIKWVLIQQGIVRLLEIGGVF